MPKFEVQLAKTIWLTIKVEAEDEEQAINTASEYAPEICAQCQGWRQPWSASPDDEYQTLEDFFYPNYNAEKHGVTVKQIGDDAKVVNED